ncbi:MAG: hypothetical protein IID33_08895, partial [Planctomycetes bacterium]|nr:hypothetical protein [Planctomycetota bacterium]
MARINRLGGAICVAVVVVSFLAGSAGQAEADEFLVTWVDLAPGHLWTDAANWDPNVNGGPRDNRFLQYLVTVPGGFVPVTFDAPSPPVFITDFSLGDDSRLVLDPDTDLTVLRTTEIAGIIDAQGGNFTAPEDPKAGSAAFIGNRARVHASGGSIVEIGAPTYSSTDLFKGSNINSTWTLMTAADPDTLLDLSALTDLDAGFNDGDVTSNATIHKITSSGGATINLSSVTTITGPAQHDDRLEIEVLDAMSEIWLDDVQTITTTAQGQVLLKAYDGGTLTLPSASSFHHTRFFASTGGSIVAAVTPATYSSTALHKPADNGS